MGLKKKKNPTNHHQNVIQFNKINVQLNLNFFHLDKYQ